MVLGLGYGLLLWASLLGSARAEVASISEGVEIGTRLGRVRGFRLRTEAGNEGEVFLGLPYGEPPLGNLRFRPSRLLERPWKGVRDATEYGADCWTTGHLPREDKALPQSEDCLFLNVVTSKRCLQSHACPVFFYIFGGGFIGGSSAEYPEWLRVDHFASRDIVTVLPNFRLNQLGTWWMESPETPGNYFTWDQINALKWVQREIAAFGGDPQAVTVSGCSSGAMSASLLTLTHVADNLYHQAIHFSGTSVTPIFVNASTIKDRPSAARDLTLAVGCIDSEAEWTSRAPEEIIACMRALPVERIVKGEHGGRATVAPEFRLADGPDGLFNGAGLESLVKGRKPRTQATSLTSREWALYLVPLVQGLGLSDDFIRSSIVPGACHLVTPSYDLDNPSQAVVDACADFYRSLDLDGIGLVSQIISDCIFNLPSLRDAHSMSAIGGSAYLYVFNYTGSGEDPAYSPAHGEDQAYLIQRRKPHGYDATDLLMDERYTAFVADFIQSGRLEGAKLRGPGAFNYLDFSIHPVQRDGLYREAYRFWYETAPGLMGPSIDRAERRRQLEPLQPLRAEILADRRTPPALRHLLMTGGVEDAAEESSLWPIFLLIGSLALAGFMAFLLVRNRRRRKHYQSITEPAKVEQESIF